MLRAVSRASGDFLPNLILNLAPCNAQPVRQAASQILPEAFATCARLGFSLVLGLLDANSAKLVELPQRAGPAACFVTLGILRANQPVRNVCLALLGASLRQLELFCVIPVTRDASLLL